jgi:ankyrin repeat protein
LGKKKTITPEMALIKAVKSGSLDEIKKAISDGADLKFKGPYNLTALHIAAREGESRIVKYLLTFDKIWTNDILQEVISLAQKSLSADGELIKLIQIALKKSITFSKPKLKKESKIDDELIKNAEKGDLIKVKEAISKGANINCTDIEGATSLFWASRRGHDDVVHFLLNSGADPNTQTIYESTCLIEAARDGHLHIAKLLLDHHANVNMQTNDGATALMIASSEGHREIVKYLIARGADKHLAIKGTKDHGKTAISFAIENKHNEIVDILLND